MMIKMDAVITAAGKNSRMINDFRNKKQKPVHKLKLKINDKEILIHTIENIRKSDVNNIIIVLGHHKDEIYQLLKDYNYHDEVIIKYNEDVNVGLSQSIINSIKDNLDEYYLFAAGDQPTLSTTTINKMINVLNNSSNPKNMISILARRKTGVLDSAEGLGMPFCAYGRLMYDYLKDEDDNLNPILRKMIDNNVDFYGVESSSQLELENINRYDEYLSVKKRMEEEIR